MNVFISGASGLVGGNCLRHFKSFKDWNTIGTYFSYQAKETSYFNTLDLLNPENFDVHAFEPDVIIHCGALTHVDYCEDHEEESYQKTVQSTANLIELCKRTNAKFIYISSDYVFDGFNGPYLENESVNPLSVYGKHKLKGEELVKEAFPENHLIVRITNVYGQEERGKNFVARMIQNSLSGNKIEFPLPIDQYATPVNAFDVARALRLLISDGKNGIYNIASTDFVNRIQLAEMVLKHFDDHKVKVNPVKTEDLNQKANRPLLGGLISKKFLEEYPNFLFTNVDDFVREQKVMTLK